MSLNEVHKDGLYCGQRTLVASVRRRKYLGVFQTFKIIIDMFIKNFEEQLDK